MRVINLDPNLLKPEFIRMIIPLGVQCQMVLAPVWRMQGACLSVQEIGFPTDDLQIEPGSSAVLQPLLNVQQTADKQDHLPTAQIMLHCFTQ